MALHTYTEFISKGLEVAYRGSSERQKLTISLTLPMPYHGGEGAIAAELVERIVNEGGAGGDVFDPQAGFAKQLSGDRYPDGVIDGPSWVFQFEVAGVAPAFVRPMVEIFARSGGVAHRVTRMEIRGELPLDGTALSVDTKKALAWLGDPRAYPAAWGQPPFEVKDVDVPSGFSLRVVPSEPPSAELKQKLLFFYQGWGELVTGAMWSTGGGRLVVPMEIAPKLGMTKKHVTLTSKTFLYEPKPARDMLLNLLVGFHHRVAPLAAVELSFPK